MKLRGEKFQWEWGGGEYSDRRLTKGLKFLWLVANPIKEERDVTYVTGKMEEMVELNKAAQEEKDMQNKVHWKGLEPFIRFIHCLCDFDEISNAFNTSLTCLTRIELDGKRLKEIGRKDPWEMIAQKWNDQDFLFILFVSTFAQGLQGEFSMRFSLM
jgi:hypothetical protein